MKMRLLGDKAAWKWGYLELRPLDNTQPRNNEGGSSLGSRAPKGRVPLIRPRRDRIMGSSILASLSEAGGNDPFLPVSGPLPPHVPVDADRVGTRPTGHPYASESPRTRDRFARVFSNLQDPEMFEASVHVSIR